MAFCIIINPNAGKKKGLDEALHLRKALDEQGIAYEALVSEAPGQDLILAKSVNQDNYEGVIVVGGDGTLFEVINGLLRNKPEIRVPLGIIPVGTGNSFIKDLGIENREAAIAAILSGNTRDVDVGEFSSQEGSFHFVNLLGAGFVSNVAYRAGRYKKLGPLSYVFGVLEELMVMKPADIRLTIDGKEYSRNALFVEICNSRYTGGDMMMAPGASIADGLFDIVVAGNMSRFKLLKLFPSIFKGRHVEDPLIEVFQGASVRLEAGRPLALTPDGETFGETPISVQMHPGKVRMFC